MGARSSRPAFDGSPRFGPERLWEETPAVSDGAVSRVLVLGDIHDNAAALSGALHRAALLGCDALVQVGDFWLQDAGWAGWDPQTRRSDPAWAELLWLAVESPIPVVVLDGNHEAWPCLTEFAQRPDVIAARAASRPLHLGGSLWWADRGSTWTWGGIRCGALGGAVSPDKFIERLAPYRWPDHEAPSRDDLARLLANAPDGLDVLFCHDAPAGVRGLRGMPDALIPTWILAECKDVQGLLQDAVEGTEPRLVFHGHWHERNHEHIRDGDTEVFGLDRDGRVGCFAVLNLGDLSGAYCTGGGG